MNLQPPFVAPRYDGYNFSNLPATILYWLTGHGAPALAPEVLGDHARRYECVILIFVDGFGWDSYQRWLGSSPFLQQLARHGQVCKITAQFPSTTAAHVTSLHTGLRVADSGIYEWQYYEPQLDAVITPLLCSFAGTMQRDQLVQAGVDPTCLYPSTTLYQALALHGVTSYSFGYRDFTPSTYSSIVMRGATLRPFSAFRDALSDVAALARDRTGPTYLTVYHNAIDTLAHLHGPAAAPTRAEITVTLAALERRLLATLRGLSDTLLVLVADHGLISVSPKEGRYLNADPALRRVIPYLRRDARGQLLPPGGSPRDVFLYVEPEHLQAACDVLAPALDGYADVILTSELLAAGFFGPPPFSPELLGRLGNLTILPHADHQVWWLEPGHFGLRHFGNHGGLTPTEMEIPLALLDLSA